MPWRYQPIRQLKSCILTTKQYVESTKKLRKKIAFKTQEEFKKLSSEIEIDDVYFGSRREGNRGRAASGKVLVLGMLERKGKVFTKVFEHIERIDVLEGIKDKVDRGSIFSSDKFRSYKSLFVLGRHYGLDHAEKFTNGKVHINGLKGFWSFAKERMP